MVAFFKRPPTEEALDARIAGLSRRAQPLVNLPDSAPTTAPIQNATPPLSPMPAPQLSAPVAAEISEEDRLLMVRDELLARLTAELSSAVYRELCNIYQ